MKDIYIYNFYNKPNIIFKPNIDKYNKQELLKNLFHNNNKNYLYYGINLNKYTDKISFQEL